MSRKLPKGIAGTNGHQLLDDYLSGKLDAEAAVPAQRLTLHQLAMLRTAVEHPDGTVLAQGFDWSAHSEATAKALVTRGLVRPLLSRNGHSIYVITDEGRAALKEAR